MKRIIVCFYAALSVAFAQAATLNPVQLLNPTGSTAGQAIVSTGGASVPAWGNVTATALAAQAANTVVANATGASAAPTALAVPSCSATGNALNWTSGTGFTCNTSLFSSPTITTPNITGITSGANGAAGSVGQCITSNVPVGSAVSLATGVAKDITSVSLTAGDWLVTGQVTFAPAGSTVVSSQAGWTSTTSATVPTVPNNGAYFYSATVTTAGVATTGYAVGLQRINVSSGTTVFLTTFSTFATSTQTAYGFMSACRWH